MQSGCKSSSRQGYNVKLLLRLMYKAIIQLHGHFGHVVCDAVELNDIIQRGVTSQCGSHNKYRACLNTMDVTAQNIPVTAA